MMTEMLPAPHAEIAASSAAADIAGQSINQEAFHPRLLVLQYIAVWIGSGLTAYQIERQPFSWCLGKGGWPVYNTTVICPYCMRQWLYFSDEANQPPYSIRSWSCERCPAASTEFPGSLLEIPGTGAYDEVLLEALPEQLLRREFEIHLKAFQ